jgi:Glycosyl hydrolases family 43/FlgD Ig-like domain
LRWSGGATDLTFAEARRCTLLVQSDPGEGRLPAEWRLLWVADSCDISPIPLGPGQACQPDVAEVTDVERPRTTPEIAENLTTVHYCSSAGPPASIARFVLDLPGRSRGRFKVIALDPSDIDSVRVIQSQVITFNGGVEEPFPSVLLRTSTSHHSTEFQLRAFGAGLSGAHDLTLVAPDGSWKQPLNLVEQTEESIFATAPLAASVPAAHLEGAGENNGAFNAPVLADPPPQFPALSDPPEGCEYKMREVWPDHDPYLIQPQDFAFVPGGWTPAGTWAFHIFYIRHNQVLAWDNTTKNLGHAVSDTLSGWTVVDTAAIAVRPGRFDSDHVWAPSIVRKGLTYFLFYTGVDASGDQRIGLATSTDLVTWTQGDSILEVTDAHPTQIPWADPSPDSLYGGHSQLRDPFVTEDPNTPGDYLMYYVTVRADRSPEMVVGLARSDGDLNVWGQTAPIWSTSKGWPMAGNPPTAFVVESPHIFQRNGSWWLFSTVNGDSVWSQSNPSSPSDTTSSNWSQTQKLWTLVPPLQAANLYFWHATEYLQISALNDIEYLAAFNDANVCVSITQMRPASSPYLFSMGCPSVTDVGDRPLLAGTPRLMLTGLRPARSRVGLRIELPARMRVHLAIYDVLGRRVRTVSDGELPAGGTELWWDGKDASGNTSGSGVYFASLVAAGTRHSVRVPLIR